MWLESEQSAFFTGSICFGEKSTSLCPDSCFSRAPGASTALVQVLPGHAVSSTGGTSPVSPSQMLPFSQVELFNSSGP